MALHPNEYYNQLYRTIAQVYYSGMDQDLKNDCICRLLSEAFKSGCVSMLHFDGAEKQLICVGNCINDNYAQVTYRNDKFKDIVKNIDIFQYFKYVSGRSSNIEPRGINSELIDYKYFSATPFFNFSNNKEDGAKRFSECIAGRSWLERLDLYYSKYRKLFSGHKIHLESGNPSAVYFKDLINGVDPGNVPCSKNTSSISLKEKPFLNLLQKRVGITLKNDYYVSIPLIANKRYFGLIRILMDEANWKLLEEDQSMLMSVGTVISLNYGNQYSLDKLKKLSLHDFIHRDKADYNSMAEALRDSINCYGCIIRLPDAQSLQTAIVGYTPKSAGYVRKLRKRDPLLQQQKGTTTGVLNTVFNNDGNNQKSEQLIGFKINLQDLQNPSYFYTYQDENIKETNIWIRGNNGVKPPDFKRLFVSDHRKMLKAEDIEEILIMPIPYVNNSYISFANTSYRIFTPNDIEFVHQVITRIGLELSNKIEKQWEVYYDISRMILHEFATPVSEIGYWFDAHRRVEKNKGQSEIPHLWTQYMQLFLSAFEFDPKGDQLSPQWKLKIGKEVWSLEEEILTVTDIYNYKWKETNLKISASLSGNPGQKIKGGKGILRFVLFNLLTNAKKFRKKGTKVIHLEAQHKGDKITLSVKNNSEFISDEELSLMGSVPFRTNYAIKSKLPGSGRGLYNISIWLKTLGGKLHKSFDDPMLDLTVEFNIKKPLQYVAKKAPKISAPD